MEPRPSQPRSGSGGGSGGSGQGDAGRAAAPGGASSAGYDPGRPERSSGAGAFASRPADPRTGPAGAGARPPASTGARPPSSASGAGAYPYSTAYPSAAPNPYAVAPPAVPTSEYGPVRDIYDPDFIAAQYGGNFAPDLAARDVPAVGLTGLEPRTARRRRAILSGFATALAVVLVVGLIAFAVWRTQDGDGGRDAARAGAGTPPATLAGGQPTATGTEADQPAGAGDVAAGAPGETARPTEETGDDAAEDEAADDGAQEEAGDRPADEPAAAEDDDAAGEDGADGELADAGDESGSEPTANPGGRSLANLVPADDEIPDAFVLTDEGELDQEGVAATFGDPDAALAQLETWGWRGNRYRQFERSPEAPAEAGATTFLVVSVHRFDSAASANEALTYFADTVIAGQGLQPVEVESLGDESLALVGNPDDATLVVLYIRTGPYLIRIGGASPDGDPTRDVVSLARVVLVNEPEDAADPADDA